MITHSTTEKVREFHIETFKIQNSKLERFKVYM